MSVEHKVYTELDLYMNPFLLSDEDGYLKTRDDLTVDNLDIQFETYMKEKIFNIYTYYVKYTLYAYIRYKLKLPGSQEVIMLDERQIYSLCRSFHILMKTGKLVNISAAGSGKTYEMLVLSIILPRFMSDEKYTSCKIIVFSKKSQQVPWLRESSKNYYGVGSINYVSLDNRSTDNKKGFIYRSNSVYTLCSTDIMLLFFLH